MEGIDREKIGKRLKDLRLSRRLSESRLGHELNNLIGYDTKANVMNLNGDTGKQTVSQLERGRRGLTIGLAAAYAEFFNVSLDYLYMRTDDWQPDYKGIKEVTGLSDEAIDRLKSMNQWDIDTLNTILVNDTFFEFLKALLRYKEGNTLINFRETCNNHDKLRLHYTRLLDEYRKLPPEELEKSGIDLQYLENELDSIGGRLEKKSGIRIKSPKKYYEEPTFNVSLSEAKTVGLFRISRLAERLAEEFSSEDSGERPAQKNP